MGMLEFLGLNLPTLCPLVYTFKNTDDIKGIIEKLDTSSVAMNLGIDMENVMPYIDENKDFAVILAKGKTHNRVLVIILVDASDIRNNNYFIGTRDFYSEDKKEKKLYGEEKTNNLIIPTRDIGGISDPLDIMSGETRNSWDKIEDTLAKHNGWTPGLIEKMGTRRRVEINIISYKTHDDANTLIERTLNPDKNLPLIKENVKIKITTLGFRPLGILQIPGVPVSVLINDYKGGGANTVQCVILIERDRFRHKELFEGKNDIPAPINKIDALIFKKTLTNPVDECEEVIYGEFKDKINKLSNQTKKLNDEDKKKLINFSFAPSKIREEILELTKEQEKHKKDNNKVNEINKKLAPLYEKLKEYAKDWGISENFYSLNL